MLKDNLRMNSGLNEQREAERAFEMAGVTSDCVSSAPVNRHFTNLLRVGESLFLHVFHGVGPGSQVACLDGSCEAVA